jgi:uncharacterized membrane protein
LLIGHASTAVACLLMGAYQLLRRIKGDPVHRVVGWVWVLGMVFVASSSFAIRELREGKLSLLHVLSVVTLISLALGVRAARRHDVPSHQGCMLGSWLGLGGAFIGAVAVPVRKVPTFAVSHPLGALAAAGAIVGLSTALIMLAHGINRLRRSRYPRTALPTASSRNATA